MEWEAYKAICDRPDHWTRWMLEQCVDLLAQLNRADLGAHLAEALAGEPLATPRDHKGPPATEMLRLDLGLPLRAEILALIEAAHTQGLTTLQTRRRGLGGFVEAWREYVAFEAED